MCIRDSNNILVFIHSAYDAGLNIWDDGSGGNYWIDYTGSDDDGDGIGEDPYFIDGGTNQDNYPYVDQNGWPNAPPTQPHSPDPSDGAVDVSVTPELSWVGSDPDADDLVTYDVYFGTTNPPSKIINNQSWSSFSPPQLQEDTTYYWKIVAWDTEDESVSGPLWSFTTGEEEIPDTTDPIISIDTPESAFYYKGNKLFNTFKPIIIGNINIVAHAYDEQSGIDRVEFYDGENHLGTDTTEPYGIAWDDNTPFNFRHILRVEAFDIAGNNASIELSVLEFR